jgi:alcohol dehydrogenase class IV
MTVSRPGSVGRLAEILEAVRPTHVALFTGGRSYDESGAAAAVEPLLLGYGLDVISHLPPNPTAAVVTDAAQRLQASPPDLIVAVGGGSVVDVAKAARGLMDEPDVVRAIVKGGASRSTRTPPLVAVPTTAGAGSEATHFAVVYVDGVKYSVGNQSFRPDYALLDPQLTYSMSPRLTGETGFDALSQAMESIWSVGSTPASLEFARQALALAWGNLEQAVRAPTPEARASMTRAAHLAGRAIDVSKTTAAHALSYPLTAGHGVAHGHAVALTLGRVLECNADVSEGNCADPRGTAFVRARVGDVLAILDVGDPASARRALTSLLERVGLETTLTTLGIDAAAAGPALLESVDAVRLANNPRVLGRPDLVRIIEAIG